MQEARRRGRAADRLDLLGASTTTTDTIDYVATDTNSLTSTSTRTVIVESTP